MQKDPVQTISNGIECINLESVSDELAHCRVLLDIVKENVDSGRRILLTDIQARLLAAENILVPKPIDEIRVTRGVARYAENLTLPTEAFPDTETE